MITEAKKTDNGYKVWDSRKFTRGKELLDWRKCDHNYRKYRLSTCTYLEDIILDMDLTPMVLKVFVYIGTNVLHKNYAIIDYNTASVVCGCSLETFNTAIGVLEDRGMLKEMQSLAKKTEKLIAVVPSAYWNGNYAERDNAVKKWYSGDGGKRVREEVDQYLREEMTGH